MIIAAALLWATVLSVHDGDTFTVEVSGRRDTVRIENIDTPELGRRARCASEAASAETARAALSTLLPIGETIRLDPATRRDRYGRLIARVILPDGRDAGALMMAKGLARPWRGRRESWCPVAPPMP